MSQPLFVACAAGMVLTGLLPVAFALAGGAMVGSVREAAALGFDSAPGHRLVLVTAVVAALFVAQQVSGPVLRQLADALGRRLNRYLGQSVMSATLTPTGIAHLEDPTLLDEIADAQSIGTGQVTPREAVVGLASVGGVRVGAAASAVLLTGFRWWMGIVLLAVHGGVTLVLTANFKRTIASLRGNVRRFRRSSYFRDLALMPGAAKEVRVFGLGDWVGERFHDHWRTAMSAFWAERGKARWLGPMCALVVALTQAGTYALLGLAAARHEISLGKLTTFAVAVGGVAAVRTIGGDNLNIFYGAAAVPVALRLQARTSSPESLPGGEDPCEGLPAVAIRFEGVSFRYPGRHDDVFRDLDLEIAAGRSLAIVGDNGTGKTTLVKLLARLHSPTSGRIVVDGVDLSALDPAQWRARVAAIFQDFTHYHLSAADNVGFGAPACLGDRGAIVEAGERAGVAEIIAGLPRGWDTVLSREFRDGAELSGGQWQRLALARALFAVHAGARVLVLDEPTAALDVRAEAAFYERFLDLTKGLTTIVISHRFSTVRRADRIVVIEDGRVVEDGDHEGLLAAEGRYARMFRLQAAHFVDRAIPLDAESETPGATRA